MFKPSLFTALLISTALATAPTLAQDTHKVTDRMGREVKLPIKVDRIVTEFLPFPSAWFISTGSADAIAGMHPDSMRMAERALLGRIAPALHNAETGFTQGNSVNVEELLRLAPDVFVSYETMPAIADVARTGIPVLAMDVLSNSGGNVIQTYSGWMQLLGQVAGQEARTQEIIAYGQGTLDDTRSRLASLSDAQKPGALFFARLEEKSLKVNGAGHFGNFWLTESGAVNLAPPEFTPLADIDMEQIYKLDPEVMFISNFSATQPEDLYENRIPGQDWSHVRAVQNQRVYKIPEGIFQWYPPSADAPLMLKWMAQKNQPELFSHFRIEDEIKTYYGHFYGYDLSDTDVQLILKPQL
ncbi:ABC transporter substrate-binding protein [Devosia sp.]|uniref:ABC transporter substrate-binding protein n=1 Tax=Devosia sp. TaxID=1871048 RepID=UPI0027375D49|nr:ABC transporter substrate-binding protein [Devosia sp.]MDP2780456.1 ABC transporter substrate-binding protein [Devosia sp.]